MIGRSRSIARLLRHAGAVVAALCLCLLAALGASFSAAAPAAAAPGPESLAAASVVPRLHARAAILVEGDTGQQLYGLNADQELPIASTTKLMTALVVLQHTPLGRIFTQPDYVSAAQDSQIYLRPGERMSVHDLLLALMLPSADDAAEDLAYNVGHGSVARFETMMNAEAARLGLRHTHYTTPIGLDTAGNYSTASDLVRLTSYELRREPWLARAVALPGAVLRTGSFRRRVVNRNDLVARFSWIDGVKTGHTLQAGYVLIASAHRDGMWLLSAVLGTPSELERDAATLALLRYGFSAFRRVTVVHAGELVARPAVYQQPSLRARVVTATGLRTILRRGEAISRRLELPRRLEGPLRKGARLGRLVLLVHGHVLASVPLVLARAIPSVSGLTVAARFLLRPITLLVMVVLLLGLGVGLVRRERVRGMRRGGRTR